jgi:hypothetical protein
VTKFVEHEAIEETTRNTQVELYVINQEITKIKNRKENIMVYPVLYQILVL